MGQKAEINGTGYGLKGGKALIGGTAYAIKKGRTLKDGTGYDIAFAKNIPVTIPAGVVWSNDGSEQGEASLVTDCGSLLLNGSTIMEPTTLNISRSDAFVARLRSRSYYARVYIVVNGVYKVNESTNDVYKDYNLWDYIPEEAVSATVKVGYWVVPIGGFGGEVQITTT